MVQADFLVYDGDNDKPIFANKIPESSSYRVALRDARREFRRSRGSPVFFDITTRRSWEQELTIQVGIASVISRVAMSQLFERTFKLLARSYSSSTLECDPW